MRLTKTSPLAEYVNVKTAIYYDSRCVISKYPKGLICVFRDTSGVASKRQRDWMYFVFNRLAKKEMGKYRISESKSGHFHLIAYEVKESEKAKSNKKTQSQEAKS